MARDYISIGSSPADEPCAQVGEPDYHIKANKECKKFIELIRKELGKEPDGARLSVKGFPHDFGTYYEVVCWYDDALPDSVEYAFKCEAEAPTNWPPLVVGEAVEQEDGTILVRGGAILCPNCNSRHWSLTYKSPIDPAEDKFNCIHCGTDFKRYER